MSVQFLFTMHHTYNVYNRHAGTFLSTANHNAAQKYAIKFIEAMKFIATKKTYLLYLWILYET